MALSTEKIIEELSELIRYDYDALGSYTAAVDDIKELAVRGPLSEYKDDHQRHVDSLSGIVRQLGGEPPDRPDVKGFLRKTMTKVAGLGGTEYTLKAMRSNEEVLNKTYAHHFAFDFPAEIKAVIQQNYEDEKRHLAWVDEALRSRLWEGAGANP